MSDPLIKCPKCNHAFALTESLEKKLRSQIGEEFEEKSQKLEDELASRDKEIARVLKEQASDRSNIEKEIARRLVASRKEFEAAAKDAASVELTAAKQELEEQASKLQEAQQKEIELRKAQRQLEQEKNEFQLKMTRELDQERSKIVEDTARRIEEEHSYKELEWNKQKSDMIKQMEEMRRKAEQGSQQTQGESFELQIEDLLKETFPFDSIDPVAKGVKGGDILQTVNTKSGTRCGAILWELKVTKAFSDGWIAKLKDDQREAKADLAVIVTSAMPKGTERIVQMEGVWVIDLKSMLGTAMILRASLLEVSQARRAQAGRKEKAEELYEYINGIEFRGRIQTLVESFTIMQDDLNTEKRALEKSWGKREKQILRAIGAAAGMYGDMQGVIGAALPEIKALAMDTI